MGKYIVLLPLCMLCFFVGLCGAGSTQYPRITDPNKQGYCGQFNCTPESNCPTYNCRCKSSMTGFFYTRKECVPLSQI
ncbi:hypothetical protein MRX96_014936 [Rhipicephalus microplus]